MKKKLILLFMFLTNFLYAYINIYPSFFFKELKKEGTAENFILTNRSNQTVRYRIYPEKPTTDEAIVELYPRSIVLKPYETKEIKLLITPSKKLKKGTYSFPIVIKEVIADRNIKKRTYTMLRLNLLGYYGDLKVKIETNIKKLDNNLSIRMKNIGERLGVFSIYVLREREWEFLDSVILKQNESWEENYKISDNSKKIKIEEENGKIYYEDKIVK